MTLRQSILGFSGGVLAALLVIWVLPRNAPQQPQAAARPDQQADPRLDQTACLASKASADEVDKACTALLTKTSNPSAAVLVARARALITLGQDDKAGVDLDLAARLDPNYATAFTVRGQLYLKQRSPQQAVEHLNRAIELGELTSEIYTSRAEAFARLYNYSNAISDLNQAIGIQPQQSAAFFGLRGNAFFNQRKFAEAAADLKKAIEIEPNYAQAQNDLGATYIQQGDLEAAVVMLGKAAASAPPLALAHENRGFALARQGRYSEAIVDFDKALSVAPESRTALGNRCWAFAMIDDLQRAREDCEKAIRTDRDNIAIFDTLGIIELKANAFEKAIEYYDKVIKASALPASLYGRGIAKQRMLELMPPSDADRTKKEALKRESDRDIANAAQLDPQVEKDMLPILSSALRPQTPAQATQEKIK